jgi:glycine/D-amino acid oxidase-like deaminating enzyme/nitrite reductase/ring-hydroxylating ferredoxin subunit
MVMQEGGSTKSVWMPQSALRLALVEDATCDVCIVGAGIAGLTTAYLLAREGKSVIVLDDGPIGGGETGRTTAHISNALDDRYFEIENLHGEKGARLAAESHTAAIDRIQAIVEEEKIECQFERLDGYLFVPAGESADVLDKELNAAHRAGLTDVEMVERAPLRAFETGRSLKFPRQAQFHPLKYIDALAQRIEAMGGRIFTQSRVMDFQDGAPSHVTTATGRVVSAGAIVVATNTPSNDRFAIHTKQAPYRTFAIGLSVPRGTITRALYWDTPDPYHYVRLQGAGELEILIVGGEDHKTGQADDADERFDRLEAWTRQRFPEANDVQFRWSGQVMEPVDSLAFIGRNPGDQHTYIITGDSGHGMTHAMIGGIILTDLILGRSSEWAGLYDPSRISLKATTEFIKENLNVASQYSDFATAADVDSPAEIPSGTGALIRHGLTKLAVYRDNQGQLHTYSAVCPHLGCIVDWNSAEKTWDCPCHGSRFDPYGKVLNGPSIADLEPANGPRSADR